MRFLSILCIAALSVAAADAPRSLGGKWRLNVDRSTWGKRDKPTAGELNIENQDPSIRYSGVVLNADATDRREFKFEGAIDGQPHRADGPDGQGEMTIRRINADTTRWTYRSDDGKVNEESTVTVSKDGRELTRRIHRKTPQGDFTWTEVYEKAG